MKCSQYGRGWDKDEQEHSNQQPCLSFLFIARRIRYSARSAGPTSRAGWAATPCCLSQRCLRAHTAAGLPRQRIHSRSASHTGRKCSPSTTLCRMGRIKTNTCIWFCVCKAAGMCVVPSWMRSLPTTLPRLFNSGNIFISTAPASLHQLACIRIMFVASFFSRFGPRRRAYRDRLCIRLYLSVSCSN